MLDLEDQNRQLRDMFHQRLKFSSDSLLQVRSAVTLVASSDALLQVRSVMSLVASSDVRLQVRQAVFQVANP